MVISSQKLHVQCISKFNTEVSDQKKMFSDRQHSQQIFKDFFNLKGNWWLKINWKSQATQCVLMLFRSVKCPFNIIFGQLWAIAHLSNIGIYCTCTKTVDSVADAHWLACQTRNKFSCTTCICLRATREKMASLFASVTSEEIIQIEFCGVC